MTNEKPVVRLTIEGNIACVIVDNPPVNAINANVRTALHDTINVIAGSSDVQAVVLYGAGQTFVAGGDITELGKPPQSPTLPDIISAIEGGRVPWVAALHGNVLGGGLELALGCHSRIAAPDTKLGLPEVTLGIVPGAGGTVRLPRLIDPTVAADMVSSGRPINAARAYEIGLLDHIVQTDLIQEATALARGLATAGRPIPLTSRQPVSPPTSFWDSARDRIHKSARGQQSPLEALEAVMEATLLPAPEALQRERARFLRLGKSIESRALRHVFFAERQAGASLRKVDAEPANLARIGVIGGGTMGTGIATAFLLAGSHVTLVEQDSAGEDRARERIHDTLTDSRRRGKLTDAGLEYARRRLETATELSRLASCELVVEAVFEDMEVKAALLKELDEIVAENAILASNTSYLDINALAERTKFPERVLGLHFFSPAHVMKLLEVVRTDITGARALATARAVARRLGKTAIVSGVCDGFIGNRIMSAYRRECDFLLEEGALPHEIDAAMTTFGFAMGIYAVQDMAGLDIAWAMRKRREATRSPTERYSKIADRLCEAGRFGRKTGLGWFRHAEGVAHPDPIVEQIIQEESERLGIVRRQIDTPEIIDRIMVAMQSESQAVLDEQVAEAPGDIDIAMILGYGFPRHKGGPMFQRDNAM